MTESEAAEKTVLEMPETPHIHHHTTGHSHRWFDIILAVSVLGVAIGSLLVSIHSSQTMAALVSENAKLVRANSTPLLQLEHGNLDDKGQQNIRLHLRNVGTGPGYIHWFELSYGDKVYSNMRSLLKDMEKTALFQKLAADRPYTPYQLVTAPSSGITLPTRDEVALLEFQRPNSPYASAVWATLDSLRFHLKAQACYCSLFDECWITKFDHQQALPVKMCDAKGHTNLDG